MRLAAASERGLVDLTKALQDRPRDVRGLFEVGERALVSAAEAAGRIEPSLTGIDRSAWRSPVLQPRKVLGVGGNYRSHIVEAAHLGARIPAYPAWFNKQTTSVSTRRSSNLKLPDSDQLDYEGELGVVIGRRCRRVGIAEALGARP